LTSDTGASSLDGITRAGGLTITGVETGATLLYSVDGGPASASYDPTKLLDGAHTVLVTQTDVAGNTSTASSLSFVANIATVQSDTLVFKVSGDNWQGPVLHRRCREASPPSRHP
ncbi:Ig-like domain-containing protein, partial [Methylobacterium sp. E-041]|uniref:Ig-like domain-containing protein n=1 Tax=Methylobacterium sp. E-041 TaxID=2836573 RepID=UPI001FBBC323